MHSVSGGGRRGCSKIQSESEEKYAQIVRRYFESAFAAEFFDTDALIRLLDDHVAGKANNGRKIWTVFTFLVWYKRFFIDFILPVYN